MIETPTGSGISSPAGALALPASGGGRLPRQPCLSAEQLLRSPSCDASVTISLTPRGSRASFFSSTDLITWCLWSGKEGVLLEQEDLLAPAGWLS